MGKETEHKYLVKDNAYLTMASRSHKICQAYLSKDPERTVRIRICDNAAFITIKGSGEGDTRPEFEYQIPLGDARELMRLALPGEIEKTRYIVPFQGYEWEIDEFHGRHEGLVIAEIELNQSTHDYPLPPFIGREVTGNPTYFNSNM
ncbi:MAG: CYTH domain-containing protein [Muribaculaceae bacterium]|nr:CYTH domain-containing protein [Muribaculaceae bacterium]